MEPGSEGLPLRNIPDVYSRVLEKEISIKGIQKHTLHSNLDLLSSIFTVLKKRTYKEKIHGLGVGDITPLCS